MERFTLDKLPPKVLAKIDFETAFMASRIVVAAERLQVFRKLEGKKLRTNAFGKKLGIHPNFLQYFLNALVSLGLLKKEKDYYSNSKLAEKYFIKKRSIYWTKQFSQECAGHFLAFTVLEEILQTGKDFHTILSIKRENYVENMKKNPQVASDFTQMLYYYHQSDAQALAKSLNLKAFSRVLDVGGGSGVMSIALAKRYPHIQACIMDIRPVCLVTKKIIRKEGLSGRIKTIEGNMFEDMPLGYDVIMFCDVGTVTTQLLQKTFENLPSGGMLVAVDRFLSENRTDPLDRILYHVVTSAFNMRTQSEIMIDMKSCGFRSVKSRKMINDVSLITGIKK